MSFSEILLWSSTTYSCFLRNTNGHLDIVLNHDGRTVRLHSCDGEQTARALAYQWKRALVPSERASG
jgi:hypothetical protein